LKKRVAIIGSMGLPAKYGGFETFVHFLVLHLSGDFDFTIYCSGPDYMERLDEYMGAKLNYLPFRANGPQSVLFDSMSILHACFHSDVLLVLGSSGGILLPLARLLGKRVIFNQGGLDWQRSKWGALTQKYLHLLEWSAIQGTNVLVCDNAGISAYFQEQYGRPSHLIEYGGDQISKPALTEAFLERYPYAREGYAFAVARIQPDNNIEMILEGFSLTPESPLIFVGNWASSVFGIAIKQKYSTHPHIYLLEAIYDPEILNQFRGYCSIYIHGHSAGGTNPSLVEAMHLGLPVAAFDVSFNRATTEERALYFKTAEDLACLVRTTPAESWNSQRAVMKAIAERRYQWHIIAGKYAALF
jgi:glycosyltransferase involved in cell wall biosynthesis